MTPNASNSPSLGEVGLEDSGYGPRSVAEFEEERPQRRDLRGVYLAYFGLGVLVGAGIGAVAALLLAPRTGREARKLVQVTAGDLFERTSEAVAAAQLPERLGTFGERASEAVAAARLPERLGNLSLPDAVGRLPESVTRLPERVAASGLPDTIGARLADARARLPERVVSSGQSEAGGARPAEVRARPFWRRFRAA
jgi:hypothetical protein